MQPGARAPSDVGPVHADFVKPGIIFGYRAVCDYGSFSDGLETKAATRGYERSSSPRTIKNLALVGHIYNFGRSTQACMLELRHKDGEEAGHWIQRQKDMLRNKMRRTGLNAPSRMLLWARVSDIDTYWDEFKRQLGGWGGRLPIDGTEPLVTQQLVVGDAYYTVENMGVSEFGTWCNALISKLLEPGQEEQQPPVSLEF